MGVMPLTSDSSAVDGFFSVSITPWASQPGRWGEEGAHTMGTRGRCPSSQ